MVGADAGRPSEGDGTPAAMGLGSYQAASAPCNGSGRRLKHPAGLGRNIARADARMAEAIPDGTAAEPDFGHVETALPLLDPVRRPSEQQRAIGIGT